MQRLDITYEALDYSNIETRRVLWTLLDEARRVAGTNISLSDRAAQEIAAFVPEQLPAEELPITEELCEEAFRAGIAAKDFSVVFLQKQFRLKYIDACNLQDKLRQSGKITPVFLAGDVVCKE